MRGSADVEADDEQVVAVEAQSVVAGESDLAAAAGEDAPEYVAATAQDRRQRRAVRPREQQRSLVAGAQMRLKRRRERVQREQRDEMRCGGFFP